MASKKTGVQPPSGGKRKIIKVDHQATPKNRLSRLEKQARREQNQSIRMASFSGGAGGISGFNNADVSNADFSFYSPQLSTDFLELPQSEREKRELFRFWYVTHPIVGAAIDFHTDVPMSKIRLALPKGKDPKRNKKILHFFEEMCDRVRLFQTLYDATHEYWLHGNCVGGGTWIRTDVGIKQAKTIRVGDKVLTDKERFKKVTATCSREAPFMTEFTISGQSDSFQFSNHPVEVLRDGFFEFVKSEELTTDDYVRTTWHSETSDIDTIKLTDEEDFFPYKNGYSVRRKQFFGSLSNDEVRSKVIAWVLSLNEPTDKSCRDLAKEFGVSLHVVTSITSMLSQEADINLYKRGSLTNKAGSKTIWRPLEETPNGWSESAKSGGTYHNLPNQIQVDKDFLYLIGAWFCRGAVTKNVWEFECENDQEKSKIVKLLGSKVGQCIQIDGDTVSVSSKNNPAFVDWWYQNFNKNIVSSWISSLPVGKQKGLLEGLVDFGESTTEKYSLPKLNVAILVRDILMRSGVVPSFKREWFFNKHNFVVIVSDTPDHINVGNNIFLKIENINHLPGDVVYNFEVEDDHTYQAGLISTHNCFIFAEDHDIEIPDELLYEEKEEEVGEIDEITGEIRTRMEVHQVEKDEAEQVKVIKEYVAKHYQGWQRLRILPPEQVRLEVFQYTDKVKIDLIPSEKDRLVVMKAMEHDDEDAMRIAEDIPEQIRSNLESGQPIPLNTDPYDDFLCSSFVFHLAHKKSAYDDRGISVIERCLRDLVYQDKLRQAQTSIASRAMTPKRIVWADKISQIDVEDLRDQVDQALIDPDFTIVSNFEVHWDEIGSRDRLLDLSSEYDITNKRLFIGLRITESMLTGESSYSGERIHLDVMNTMYLLYRETLAEYVEKFIFAPVAHKKGYYEEDENGDRTLLYPKLQFTRLALRDNTELQDFMFNLYQKGSLPISYILELINIDSEDAHAQLKTDMFTAKDAVFNEAIRSALEGAGEQLLEKTDLLNKLIENMGLKRVDKEGTDRFGKDEKE